MRPSAWWRRREPERTEIVGDSRRLQQVLWNLVNNAIKFSKESGRVELHLLTATDGLRITVKDDGQGIAPSFLPYVFDRFRQQDASPTRAAFGLGLGLSIAKHLVELHGGVISAQSAGEGQGATFVVVLPSVPTHAPKRRSRPGLPGNSTGGEEAPRRTTGRA